MKFASLFHPAVVLNAHARVDRDLVAAQARYPSVAGGGDPDQLRR
jgi:hypothetical protein